MSIYSWSYKASQVEFNYAVLQFAVFSLLRVRRLETSSSSEPGMADLLPIRTFWNPASNSTQVLCFISVAKE